MIHQAPLSNIAFGVAGWSYPDWDGYLYPPRLKDKLAYVSRYVDMVEINSSFYRPPSAKSAESWLRQTAEQPGFFFTAKIHQDITHGGTLPPTLVRQLRDGLAPIADAGKLRHWLAQFRYDFEDGSAQREHLRRIVSAFNDMAHVTLELRHKSWQAPESLAFLESLGVTVANLDYPTARDSFNLPDCRVGTDRYLRLHGRNAAAWFDKKADRDETYNYRYSAPELSELRDRTLTLAKSAASLTVVANNHFQAKEVSTAIQLKSLVTGLKVPVPTLLRSKYPDLDSIAAPDAPFALE